MLLTAKQVEYLDADGDLFRFVGQDQASPQERRDLLDLDDSYTDVYGKHIITNWEEIITPIFGLDRAKVIALDYAGDGMEIDEISELPDKWIFGFRNAKTKEYPDTSPVSVCKITGRAEEFFPPDHVNEFLSMKTVFES